MREQLPSEFKHISSEKINNPSNPNWGCILTGILGLGAGIFTTIVGNNIMVEELPNMPSVLRYTIDTMLGSGITGATILFIRGLLEYADPSKTEAKARHDVKQLMKQINNNSKRHP